MPRGSNRKRTVLLKKSTSWRFGGNHVTQTTYILEEGKGGAGELIFHRKKCLKDGTDRTVSKTASGRHG